MREIKFRGFCKAIGDEDSDVMIYSGDFIETSEGIICWSLDKNGVPCIEVPILVDDDCGGMGHEQYISSVDVTVENGLQLMLYTGLKDKNGKEVYEGDIVNVLLDGFDGYIKGEVFWDEERFCWNIKDSVGDDYYDYFSGKTPFEAIEEIEIIGNIYEHKHLLEDAK